MPAHHEPVLRDRILALLAPAMSDGAVLVDATVGLGGHALAALERFPTVRLIGLDRDPSALRHSTERLAAYTDRVTLVHAVYDELPDVLTRLGVPDVHGILFDLGVSSMQLDTVERGFAYRTDAPLDMRMDPALPATAADVLNTYPAGDLVRILREFGEERYARRIVERVVRERESAPFTHSARLVDLIRESIPAAARREGGNPAKRTFQALRVEVNGELDALRRAIPAALDALALGGRIVVMSYQSLEDRMVKAEFAAASTPDVPAGLPFIPADRAPWLRLVTRGAERAGDDEVARNPRAASVRLRCAEVVRDRRAA